MLLVATEFWNSLWREEPRVRLGSDPSPCPLLTRHSFLAKLLTPSAHPFFSKSVKCNHYCYKPLMGILVIKWYYLYRELSIRSSQKDQPSVPSLMVVMKATAAAQGQRLNTLSRFGTVQVIVQAIASSTDVRWTDCGLKGHHSYLPPCSVS